MQPSANTKKIIIFDGHEQTMQVNHLSHFLLTNLLLDRIIDSRPSRIVNISSIAHFYHDGFDVKDLKFEKTPFTNLYGFVAYGWSKLANILFTRELARQLYEKGVKVNVVHPGFVKTEFGRNFSFFSLAGLEFLIVGPFMKSAHDGAQTTLYAATTDELVNISGQYFADCQPASVHVKALNNKVAIDLWKESEKLTKLAKSSK